MTLYMRKVLTSPQPSFSSMSLAALKCNKQEDSSVRRHAYTKVGLDTQN